jgi:hypothetical protein
MVEKAPTLMLVALNKHIIKVMSKLARRCMWVPMLILNQPISIFSLSQGKACFEFEFQLLSFFCCFIASFN